MKIIGITGMPASGKGTLAQQLVKKGFKRVVMSDAARAEMKKRGIPVTPASLRDFPTKFRAKRGEDIFAKLCIPLINKAKSSGNVLIDGIRSPDEINTFKKEFGADFVLIAVLSDEKNRYSRVIGRKRDDDAISFEEFKRRDEIELSWGVGGAIEMADEPIPNNDAPEDFEKEIEDLLNKILP